MDGQDDSRQHTSSDAEPLTTGSAVKDTSIAEPLLTPGEVASLFRVDPKTVTRWARTGRLSSVRTLGGHRRYSEAEVRAALAGIPRPRTADPTA
jgi:excisionase family DNA binding protein